MLGGAAFLCATLGASAPALAAPTVVPRVVATRPHDATAFTQGLLLYEGFLFESTGLYGRSSLRRVDRATGAVLQSVSLPMDEFGEGLARAGNRLIQLTYRNGVAHVYDLTSFEALENHSYPGEGWGLCHDGERLIMTDGSDRLTFRNPSSFEIIGSVPVEEDGVPQSRLNELECVGGEVYANVWQTNRLLRIDPDTGRVLTEIDASGLLTSEEAARADVLNGIAYDADTGRFLLTGKLWPKLFEVELTADAPQLREGNASCAFHSAPAHHPPWPWALLAMSLARGRPRRHSSTSSRTSTSLLPRTAA
jgi:glutaminyl-peptide cyclotransferase